MSLLILGLQLKTGNLCAVFCIGHHIKFGQYFQASSHANNLKLAPFRSDTIMFLRTVVWEDGGGDPASYPISFINWSPDDVSIFKIFSAVFGDTAH